MRHSGRFGKVVVDGTAVATISAFTYDQGRKRTPATCMGDANEVEIQGLPAVKGDWSGFWDDTDKTPFTATNKSLPCDLILYLDYTNTPEAYADGRPPPPPPPPP